MKKIIDALLITAKIITLIFVIIFMSAMLMYLLWLLTMFFNCW